MMLQEVCQGAMPTCFDANCQGPQGACQLVSTFSMLCKVASRNALHAARNALQAADVVGMSKLCLPVLSILLWPP